MSTRERRGVPPTSESAAGPLLVLSYERGRRHEGPQGWPPGTVHLVEHVAVATLALQGWPVVRARTGPCRTTCVLRVGPERLDDCLGALQACRPSRALYDEQLRLVEAERLTYVARPAHRRRALLLARVLGAADPLETTGDVRPGVPVAVPFSDIGDLLAAVYDPRYLDAVAVVDGAARPLTRRRTRHRAHAAATVSTVSAPAASAGLWGWAVPLPPDGREDWVVLGLLARWLQGPFAPRPVRPLGPGFAVGSESLEHSILWTLDIPEGGASARACLDPVRLAEGEWPGVARTARQWRLQLASARWDADRLLDEAVWLRGRLVTPQELLPAVARWERRDASTEGRFLASSALRALAAMEPIVVGD